MRKLIILLISILPLFGYSQTNVDAKDVTTRRYIIWENDSTRVAAIADSILGFVGGSDTATMIPLPSGIVSYWTRSNDSLFPATAGDNVYLLDSVYLSGVPIGVRDSVLYISNDTVYKGLAPSGGGLWSQAGGQIFPATATDNVWMKDTVIMSGIPVLTRDSLLFISNDTVYKQALSVINPLTTRGDLVYRNHVNVTSRLPVGTANQVLGTDGTDVSWMDRYWDLTSGQLSPATTGNDVVLTDSVYMSGLPTKTRDSVLYISNDTIYKDELSASTSLWQDDGGGQISPVSATSIDVDTADLNQVWIGGIRSIYNSGGLYYFGALGVFNYFGSQGDTYIRTSAAGNQISMFFGGGERVRMDATQFYFNTPEFGVGIITPDVQFHVDGQIKFEGLAQAETDSVLYVRNDSVFKGEAPASSPWTSSGGNLYPTTSTDKVSIGGATPIWALNVSNEDATAGIATFYKYNTTAGSSADFTIYKINGTPLSFSAITDGTELGVINWGGSKSASNADLGANIIVSAAENWSATEVGTKFQIYTAPIDSANTQEALTIDGDQDLKIPNGDVIAQGGWDTWSATLAWTGGTPAVPDNNIARYQVINETVHFTFFIDGTNSSGSTLTALNVTVPETPDDVNIYVPVNCGYASNKVPPTANQVAYIDAQDNTGTNRKLYITGLSIANGSDYTLTVSGFYEITTD